jgi:Sap-like sulfolipid-1-addressing protein
VGALIALVLSVGLVDSLSPSTVAPALYLATTEDAPRKLGPFVLGVFAVYLVAGVALALGPGQLLLSAFPRPERNVEHVIELILGGSAFLLAILLWHRRERVARGITERERQLGRSAWALGAGSPY